MNAKPRELDPALRETIETPLRRLRAPLAEQAPSEWSFSNLYLFRQARDWRYVDSPIPHLRGRGYDGSLQLIALCELEQVEKATLQTLQGEHAWFCPVPEPLLQRLDPAVFVWHTERDDADYLYAAAPFRDYSAAGLGPKRAAVARLRAAHTLRVHSLDASLAATAAEVLDGWCRDKDISTDGADAPECREALASLQAASTTTTFFGYLHLVDDTPAGFVLCEQINAGVIVVRFSKGLRRFDGIFPIMYQHLVLQTDRAVEWLNFEQDLGLANFRRSKLSFNPTRIVPKYRVRVRS